MAIKWKHDDSYRMYFCTFICYDWLWLYEIVNGYDLMQKEFILRNFFIKKIRAIRFPIVIAVENIGVGGQTPLRHPPIVVVMGIPR